MQSHLRRQCRLSHGVHAVGGALQIGRSAVLAQLELASNKDLKPQVYTLPKRLDEEVARLHLDRLGVKLTKLTPEQAEYIGVKVEGPYKPTHYRY